MTRISLMVTRTVSALLGLMVSTSVFAAPATCKLLIQPEPNKKFEVINMVAQHSNPGELGFIGATYRINVILNGAEDLSYVNVQVEEAGNNKYFLSINGAKNSTGEFSVGTNIRGRGVSLTCKYVSEEAEALAISIAE